MQNITQEELNQKLIESLENLPPLPETIQEIKVYTAKKGFDIRIDEVSSIIEKDPLITASLLHLANSAYYGFSREIKTINQCVILLGVNNVKNILIADYAKRSFDLDVSPYGFKTDEFLENCREESEFISYWLLEEDKELCHTLIPCVMFLRLGIMVFSKFLLDNKLDKQFLVHLNKEEYDDILVSERDFFGMNHITFLTNLFKYWNLNEIFAEAIMALDNLNQIPAKIRKEVYALAIVENLYRPQIKKDYKANILRAISILKHAKMNEFDFNLEKFLDKIPMKFKKDLDI